MKLSVWLSAAALVAGLGTYCNAQVTGTVTLDGKAPKPKTIQMPAQCAALHPDPVEEQTVVVDDKNHLQNAVVSIKEPKGNFKAPEGDGVIDQKGCMYEPHVIGLMVGQKLVAKNGDPFAHNVHTLPKSELNSEQNIQLPNVDRAGKKLKDPKAAEYVRVKCDIHGWMSMYVAVFDHPCFAVTDESGAFSIPTAGLKDGEYDVECWQERFGKTDGKVTVKDGKGKVDFTVKQPAAAANPATDTQLASTAKDVVCDKCVPAKAN